MFKKEIDFILILTLSVLVKAMLSEVVLSSHMTNKYFVSIRTRSLGREAINRVFTHYVNYVTARPPVGHVIRCCALTPFSPLPD